MYSEHFERTAVRTIEWHTVCFLKGRKEKVMKNKTQRGFTLIEMLIPVVIFGVLVLLPAVQ